MAYRPLVASHHGSLVLLYRLKGEVGDVVCASSSTSTRRAATDVADKGSAMRRAALAKMFMHWGEQRCSPTFGRSCVSGGQLC